jgi:hypothetical protein
VYLHLLSIWQPCVHDSPGIGREDGGVESERLEFEVTVFIADWSDALSQTINASTLSQVDVFSYV